MGLLGALHALVLPEREACIGFTCFDIFFIFLNLIVIITLLKKLNPARA